MKRKRGLATVFAAIVVTILIAVALAFVLGFWWGLFTAINLVAFGYYGYDKLRAVNDSWRVPEVVLLGFAAAGGVPGSVLGQYVFNHKTSKSRFKRVFWAIAILQVMAIIFLIIRPSII